MKTKALLLAGLVTLAGVVASQAQTVYSVNAVGFVNVDVPTGFSMIANPLSNSDSKVSVLLPSVPENSQLFKFDAGLGSYVINTFRTAQFGGWQNPSMTLTPGEGAFFKNPSASPLTLTFTGEVIQSVGNNPVVVSLPAGFSIASSKVPQSGALDTVLGFPIAHNDRIFRFDNSLNSYVIYTYRNGAWVGGNVPSVQVGESFFVQKSTAVDWERTFTVASE